MATLAAPAPNWTQREVSLPVLAVCRALSAEQMQPHRQSSASPAPPSGPSPHPHPHADLAQTHPAGPGPAPQQQWTPSPTAPPFYPQYPSYFAVPASHVTQHYYDPTQQQLAQWAYQQMLMNAQQQQFISGEYHRARTNSGDSHRLRQPDVFHHQQPFPFPASGTPPPQQPPSANTGGANANSNQYQGFHPYRRPGPPRQSSNRTHAEAFQPPYANKDGTGSSTSVNSSSNSGRDSPKQKIPSPPPRPRVNSSHKSADHPMVHTRSDSGSTATGSIKSPSVRSTATAHSIKPTSVRTTSTSSTSSAPVTTTSISPPTGSGSPVATQRRPAKPSPLSQGLIAVSNEEKASRRISRDDSDLAYATGSLSGSSNHVTRSGGLKGRLRRVLAINTNGTHDGAAGNKENMPLQETNAQSTFTSSGSAAANNHATSTDSPPDTPTTPVPVSATAPTNSRKSKSLFNLKFNASTDNISLSSTVSSASVMIRKIGNMGKIARRSSIAGITKLFKDKDKKKRGQDDGDTGMPDSKAPRAEASVSYATAEFERGSFGGEDMKGLSPAAQLARQHTLKSKAADEARAQALQKKQQENGTPVDRVPATWDRGTAKRNGQNTRPPLSSSNGSHLFVDQDEDEDAQSDESSDDGTLTRHEPWNGPPLDTVQERYDEFGQDDEGEEGEDVEEDVTIRLGDITLREEAPTPIPRPEDDSGQWAVWRTYQRDSRPQKSILRNANDYDQNAYLESQIPANTASLRTRANSYTGTSNSELAAPGPLARIPSPDPDHIDGLHKSEHQRNSSDSGSRLPEFSFELSGFGTLVEDGDERFSLSHTLESKSVFNHPSLNSSAPVLSTMSSKQNTTARSPRAPLRRITFAANLSIYDTFSATVYDRRCEPVTCNRLTPALAQRIKEELNTYKMEEMEVHTASRIHTHFFV